MPCLSKRISVVGGEGIIHLGYLYLNVQGIDDMLGGSEGELL